jgi:hypothetical protein
MKRAAWLCVGWLALAVGAQGQTPPVVEAAAAQPADRVVISGARPGELAYELFTHLEGIGICPAGRSTPRGFSCAQATYEVYSEDGAFLRRCTLPIFALVDGHDAFPVDEEAPAAGGLSGAPVQQGEFFREEETGFVKPEREGYFARSFRRMTCGDQKKHDVELIPLQQLMKPRTEDKTVFQLVSIIGYAQAKEICAVSKEHCVLDLFDHKRSLKREALEAMWPLY